MRNDATGADSNRSGLGHLAVTASPLPSTMLGAQAIIEGMDLSTPERIVAMIRHDPLVVSGILRVANAAHYGTQRTVTGLERATDVLGPGTVLGIITGMHLVSPPSPALDSSGHCYMRLIRHSVATGYLADALNRFLRKPFPSDTAYTAGLLHDVGRILIASNDPERARSIYGDGSAITAESNEQLLAVEQVAFGFDHTEAGEFAARRLNFPDLLSSAIRNHHRPEGAGPDGAAVRLAHLVGLADMAAGAFGWPSRFAVSNRDLDEHGAWTALRFIDPAGAREAVLRSATSLRDGLLAADS